MAARIGSCTSLRFGRCRSPWSRPQDDEDPDRGPRRALLPRLRRGGQYGPSDITEAPKLPGRGARHPPRLGPIRCLVLPRFGGCVTMLLVLVVYASLVGMLGGAIIASAY